MAEWKEDRKRDRQMNIFEICEYSVAYAQAKTSLRMGDEWP